MKLFFRDNLFILLLQPVLWIAVAAIYWMDGYRNMAVTAYATFIGLFLFAFYLLHRYYSHAAYYRLLSSKPASLEEALLPVGHAPAAEAMGDLLQNQYQLLRTQQHKNEQQQQTHELFINQWVHQMKTPISVMTLLLQEEASSHTASMQEELEKLRGGLDIVLYAARLQAFEHDFLVKTVCPHQLASQAVHEHKRLFIRSYVYPVVEGDPKLQVQTDEKWLQFILTQLITNAVKYSTGSNKKVEIFAGIKQDKAVLEVRDYGIGIEASDIKRVFDPFFTGENGRHYPESTGMGLYIVKQACDQLQLDISLTSTPGEGTCVQLIFPSWQTTTNLT